jgi:nucleotide-binding universal stress UspA family protein
MHAILVGVDGSPEARSAAELAATIAGSTGARLVLAFCMTPLATVGTQPVAAYFKSESDFGKHVLRESEAQCAGRGLDIEPLLVQGDPPLTLATIAQERDVDLVAVGHRGRGALRRALLGSCADALVQICPRPVLVVR